MLTDQDIVYIANDWVKENKTSAHHIAEVLARHNRLLYVEAAGMRSPRSTKRDARKIIIKLKKMFAAPVRVQDNFHLYSPFLLPYHRYGVVRTINRTLIRIQLARASALVGFRNPIIWLFMPHFGAALGGLRNKISIYYCVDEYSAQPRVASQVIDRMEREILRRVDLVFTVSEELLLKKQALNPNTYLSRHGVDVTLFSEAANAATPLPDDIKNIPRPIAGFFGLIEEWIDLDLVEHLAERLPDVSFVFLGRTVQDVTRFERCVNVHFLGQKPYVVLPSYLKGFDVCLLPYKRNTQVENSNPKKLREYLAGGKPVVSVPNREVARYSDFVYTANDFVDFEQCVGRAIREDSSEKQRSRIEAMRSESWEGRVERLSDIIEEQLRGSHHQP